MPSHYQQLVFFKRYMQLAAFYRKDRLWEIDFFPYKSHINVAYFNPLPKNAKSHTENSHLKAGTLMC